MRSFSIALLCLLGTATAVKLSQCDPTPVCPAPAPAPVCPSQAGGAALLNCPDLNTRGFGKISSQSKAKAQNVAKADNEYESIEEQLKWQGRGTESEQEINQGEAAIISKEVVKITG